VYHKTCWFNTCIIILVPWVMILRLFRFFFVTKINKNCENCNFLCWCIFFYKLTKCKSSIQYGCLYEHYSTIAFISSNIPLSTSYSAKHQHDLVDLSLHQKYKFFQIFSQNKVCFCLFFFRQVLPIHLTLLYVPTTIAFKNLFKN